MVSLQLCLWPGTVCECVYVCVVERSKPRIMDLIKETHVCVQCIPLRQPFNLLTLILILEVIISNVSPL